MEETKKELTLINSDFECELCSVEEGRKNGFGGDGTIDPGFWLSEALGFSKYRYPRPGDLFMYLFRRFGPPIHPYDTHKMLCSYKITTPNEKYVFGINPMGTFSILFTEDAYKEYMMTYNQGGEEKRIAIAKEAELAIKTTVMDLLRPTYVRDEYFNIMGPVSDDAEIMEHAVGYFDQYPD